MASDYIYSADIPQEFNYLIITNTGYKLYNTNVFEEGQVYEYYEFFTQISSNTYVHSWDNPKEINENLQCYQVQTTQDVFTRSDIHEVISTTFIFCLGFIFLINIFTSIIKRNGLLGGLL